MTWLWRGNRRSSRATAPRRTAPLHALARRERADPWIPVRLFMKDKFETAARAARLPKGLPVLMVHGAKDDIAPIELGRKLYAALPVEGRQFVELENAGHNDIPYQDSARYLKAVGAFLSERARRAD